MMANPGKFQYMLLSKQRLLKIKIKELKKTKTKDLKIRI